MSWVTICAGHAESIRARLMTACSTASGVLIIPPQRVTRAVDNDADHLITHEEISQMNCCLQEGFFCVCLFVFLHLLS